MRNIVIALLLVVAVSAWESTKYVWYFGMALDSDTPPKRLPVPPFRPQDYLYIPLQKGSIIWVKTGYLLMFYNKVFPRIEEPFILVLSDGDQSFPSFFQNKMNVEQLIQSEKIIHIFATNCDDKKMHAKVSPLPIGIDFHSQAYAPYWGGPQMTPREQEQELDELLCTLEPTYLRKKRAFVDFQFADTMRHGIFKRYLECGEDRTEIFQKINLTGLIDCTIRPIERKELWRKKGEYAFSISPHGNGLDTHRTWEDLVLGCIVIVKTSPLDAMYEGLPVVIVQDWSEVNEENFNKWLIQYGDAFTRPEYREKLMNTYWMKKIFEKQVNSRLES